MKIVVLACGSLVWDPDSLRRAGNLMECGPVLAIEFSRVSGNGRLTLVIDERYGVDVPTRYAPSTLDYIRKAPPDVVTPVRTKAAAMFDFSRPAEFAKRNGGLSEHAAPRSA
jgi:hypothetical protein